MTQGIVSLSIKGSIASVLFDRPQARNAMTWTMYEQLVDICTQLKSNSSIRAVTFRGVGGQAFVAGTDIEQFKTFQSGDDGVAYEQRIEHCIDKILDLPMPTVALVEGWAVGGGLVIATACDFRLATPSSKFGAPVAKTLGNCLSMRNLARLRQSFGAEKVKRMLMLAELISAEEAFACEYLHEITDDLEESLQILVSKLVSLAPLTQGASKEGLRRLTEFDLPNGDDLVKRCFGSNDFHEGVSSFVDKRPPSWNGT
tara:strand:- start:18 stop:788 length:771 start_codon:yes stop_codon:yes gene_type:complete